MPNAELTVTVGSHFFKITKISSRAKAVIVDFAKRYIKYGLVKTGRGGFKRSPIAVFAAATKDRDEYRFHINQLPEFKLALANRNLTNLAEWVRLPIPDAPVMDVSVRDGWVPKPKQIPFIHHLVNIKEEAPPGSDERPMRFIGAQPGFGKDQPLDAKLRTPDGWMLMGDVKIGDYVIAADGIPTKVTGVFPQGVKDVYRITMEDGRHTRCGLNHLWKIYSDAHSQDYVVIGTDEVIKRLENKEQLYIDLPKPVYGYECDLGITPYTMGFMSAKDLWYIPGDYLYGDIQTREELLRGIFDKLAHFTQDNERFGVHCYGSHGVEILTELVRSLGGKATPAKWDNVFIEFEDPTRWFKQKKKIEQAQKLPKKSFNGRIAVSSVYYDRQEETQCISIAHRDKLYITDNYVVTHNTFCSLKAIAEIAKRFVVLVRPMYMEKWVGDVAKTLNVREDQIMAVKGGKQLLQLLELAQRDQLGDVVAIIISNKTFQYWLKAYAKFGEESTNLGYAFLPDEFYGKLKAGVRLNDEVHLDLHLQFLIDLYTNIEKTIGLSASYVSNDSFTTNMQSLIYPPETRYDGGPLNKYVTATALFYQIRNTRDVKTMYNGSTMYSHIAFEESLMRHTPLISGYIKVIDHAISEYFMNDYVPGQRCLVFAASVALCTKLQHVFQKKYPGLKVNRYVDQDPYEYLMESDLCFSTVLSAGTAHDIDMLRTVIMTNSLESIQSNIQAFGRLREIIGLKTRFIYLVCLDIAKQVDYHRSKKELLLNRAKVYGEAFVPFSINP